MVLDGGFEGALHFGDFGYGVIVIDQKGIVRDINPHDLEEAVESAFKMN